MHVYDRPLRPQNEQRQMRKDEAAAGSSWQLRYFQHVDSDPVYRQLAKAIKGVPEEEDAYLIVRS